MTASVLRSTRFLRIVLAAAIIFPYSAMLVVDSPVPLGTRAAASLLWSLGFLPAWIYLGQPRHRRAPIPFLPIIGVLNALYYALPAVLGAYALHWRISLDPTVDYGEPVRLALTAWCLTLGTYALFRTGRGLKPKLAQAPLELIRIEWILTLVLLGLGMDIARQMEIVPVAWRAIVTFIVTLERFGLGILIVLHIRRRLSRQTKVLLVAALVANLAIQASSGMVGAIAVFLIGIILAFWVERGSMRAPTLLAVFSAVVLIVLLKGVMSEFRIATWYQNSVAMSERPRVLAGLLQRKISEAGVSGSLSDGLRSTLGRSANLELFADIVRRTPSEVPFWRGESYVSLVGMAVPRLIWRDKPTKELGQLFGHRYSYIDAGDRWTSVNLPYLIEFFVNFGAAGVMFGALLTGMIYGTLERYLNKPGQDTMVSLMTVSLLTPLLNIESDFSLIFGGLLLNGIALNAARLFLQRTAAARARVALPTWRAVQAIER